MFPNVVQIDDLIHAKQSLWEVVMTSAMRVLDLAEENDSRIDAIV